MPTTLITDAWRRPLAWAAGLAGVLVAVLAVLVHGSATSFDTWMFRELYAHIGTNGALTLLDLSAPGLPIGLLAMVALFAMLLRRWDVVALAAIAPAVAVGVTKYLLKPLIDRPLIIGTFEVHGSFPSGHETAVSSTALVLLIIACRLPIRPGTRGVLAGLLAVWTLLAAVGLVRNFWHYATDTIGALCVSVAVVSAVALVIDQAARRRARTAEPQFAQFT